MHSSALSKRSASYTASVPDTSSPPALTPADRRINLRAEDRFVPTAVLHRAYLGYEHTRAPGTPPFVALPDHGLELGIVASEQPTLARAVSSLLSRSLEDAKDAKGGHLPAAVVERVQTEIISPWGVGRLWGSFGHRFVLSRPLPDGRSELLATILVARRKGTVFFFTGRYNNLRHSQMGREIGLEQSADGHPDHRWFDCFAFPQLAEFKPRAYHHIANFVVAKEQRGQGLSRLLLDSISRYYARDYIEAAGLPILHSQFLLCGKGYWQIGDPPWLSRMQKLGFYLRWGAESFFIEHDWAPLPPIVDARGLPIDNLAYNRSFGLPMRYEGVEPPSDGPHLHARVAEVARLARNPRAKLQYFQTMFDFV